MENQAKKNILRSIPAVDEVLNQPSIQELISVFPRKLVLTIIRDELETIRKKILTQETVFSPDRDTTLKILVDQIAQKAKNSALLHLKKVINATGIIIHTNLGRAPLLNRAVKNIGEIAEGYCNLEYELEKGERGSRYLHVEKILKELSGAESALVVNNNAAAVLVALNTLARGHEVVVSRGELIEIGGSFRLPDIMRQSGCMLKEIGTTNKTKLSDYEQAISQETRLFLTAHTSNYRILGFTEQVLLKDLVRLGRTFNIPVMKDLGSGNFVNLAPYGLEDEPTVMETISSGVDIVTFSGDKLLGGPQAGVIVGEKKYLDEIKKNPLLRAIRVDKFTLAAMEVTLREYFDPEKAVKSIPVLEMLTATQEELKKKAKTLFRQITRKTKDAYELSVEEDFSQAGGGSLPLQALPTWVVTIIPKFFSVAELDKRLRKHHPPIVARINQERLLIDVRTVFAHEMPIISEALARVT
ncbi:MAG: L-seryl-tRNA(Sec) selenium transferase [Thermodesulfobacteriota bacterium]|nr:MAG: L-seryl-tRNA(Sec) selenium transferase [Thermodesulfobacteriota bacterium]